MLTANGSLEPSDSLLMRHRKSEETEEVATSDIKGYTQFQCVDNL